MAWHRDKQSGLILPNKQRGFITAGPAFFKNQGPHDPYWSYVVSLLHFDGTNGSTSIIDECGLTWTTSGGLSTTTAKFGTSSYYNYGTGYLLSQDSSNLILGTSDFTAELWLSPVSSGGTDPYGRIIQLGNDSEPGGLFWIRTDLVSPMTTFVQVCSSSDYVNALNPTATTIPNSSFTHLALTRQAGVWSSWYNGVLNAQNTFTSSGNNLTCNFLRIGNSNAGEYLNAYFDEFRLTNGIARYTANFTPPASPFPNH